MYSVWKPWHGCHKCNEGCLHCYITFRQCGTYTIKDGKMHNIPKYLLTKQAKSANIDYNP